LNQWRRRDHWWLDLLFGLGWWLFFFGWLFFLHVYNGHLFLDDRDRVIRKTRDQGITEESVK
jgi:hypothetical protein